MLGTFSGQISQASTMPFQVDPLMISQAEQSGLCHTVTLNLPNQTGSKRSGLQTHFALLVRRPLIADTKSRVVIVKLLIVKKAMPHLHSAGSIV